MAVPPGGWRARPAAHFGPAIADLPSDSLPLGADLMSTETDPPSGAPVEGRSEAKAASLRQLVPRRVSISVVLAVTGQVLGIVGALPPIESWVDGQVHGEWPSRLLLVASLVALCAAVYLVFRVRQALARLDPDGIWRVTAVALVVLLPLVLIMSAVFAAIDVTTGSAKSVGSRAPGGSPATSPAARPSATPTASGEAAVGTFSYPRARALGLPAPGTLTARGTVHHLQTGHHLLIFLRSGSTYWAGDPDVVVNENGNWSGTVCIGFRGSVTLELVDIGPDGLAKLKAHHGALWGSAGMSFAPTGLGRDVSVLSSVPVDANGTPSHCTHERGSY